MDIEDKSNTVKKSGKSALPVKLCGVCGDKALGFNFNALTCESCKAFFRRNALVSKEFKCPFNEQCQVTVLTRRFCQKCRLDKCFYIGMVKEYILSEEDKALKRAKIAENRAKKRTVRSNDDEVSSSKLIKREENEDSTNSFVDSISPSPYFDLPAETTQVSVIKNNSAESNVESSSSVDVSYKKTNCENSAPYIQNSAINDLLSMNQDKDHNSMIRSMLTTSPPNDDASKLFNALTDSNMDQPICDNSQSTSFDGYQHKADIARDVLQDVERIQLEPKSMKNILCEAIKLEFETYTTLPQSNSSSRELNDAERARLNELIVANKALLAPLDDYMTSLINDEYRFKPAQGQSDPMLLGIINLTAVAIRRLIKMAKKINAFKNMCEEDQVSLLKGGCTEMMILRSTMTYDCARDTWKVPHSQDSMGNIKADVLKLAKGNIYQEHDRFVRTFDAKWRTDENIILIMSAIVLFTPTRPKVVHTDVIKLEQNSYYYLLRRYLESIYPGCEAKSAFLKLIQKIMELQKLAEEVIGVYLDVNPSHVEPLLIEIFDLKQQQ